MKILSTSLLILFQLFVFGQKSDLNGLDLNSLITINKNYEYYSIDDYSKAFDSAIVLKSDKINFKNNIIGNVTLSALAKSIIDGIDNNRINVNSKETISLLSKFRAHKYFIYQPEVNKTIKFFGYMCLGEYAHLYSIIGNNKSLLVITIICGLVLAVILLHVFGKIQWRFKKFLNKIILVLFVLSIVLFIGFKSTCDCNVSEYSFYGIPVN